MLETGAGPLTAHTVTILEDLDTVGVDPAHVEPVPARVGTAARSLLPGLVGLTVRLDDGTSQTRPDVDGAGPADADRILEVPLGDGTGDAAGVLQLRLRSDAPDATALAELLAFAVSSSARLATLEARIDQLGEAVETRDIIGQAKGIIMAHKACDPDEAFDVLRRASQRTQRKLRDLAAEVVASVTPPANP